MSAAGKTGRSLKNSLGIVRDKTFKFEEFRQMHSKQKVRGYSKQFSRRQEKEESFLSTSADFLNDIPTVEMTTIQDPYISLFDRAMEKLKDFDRLLENFKSQASDRLRDTFGNVERVEKILEKTALRATQHLTDCKDIIKQFEQFKKTIDPDTSEMQFFDNMDKSLKLRVQNAARKLRKEQQYLFQMLNTIEQSGSTMDFFDEESKHSYFEDSNINVKMIETDQSEEIKRIYEQFTTLADLMSQMHDIVLTQGTIIDRIDYNLTTTSKHVKMGNQELKKAIKIAESGFAKKCKNILIIINLFLFVFVVLRHWN